MRQGRGKTTHTTGEGRDIQAKAGGCFTDEASPRFLRL